MQLAWVCFILTAILNLRHFTQSLKCRSTETSNQDQDMEWAVRQCVRQLMYNSTDYRQDRRQEGKKDGLQDAGGLFSGMRGWERPQRDNRDAERGNGDQNGFRGGPSTEQGGPRGGPFRSEAPGGTRRPSWQAGRYPNGRPNRNGNEERRDEEDESFGLPTRDPRRKRPRDREAPHSPGQQTQYDRDVMYNNFNRRPMFQPNNNNNNNNNNGQNKGWEESRLASIDPCMIYCIFQELKMLDEWGRLSKQAVLDRMTRRLRDRDLREFLQFTVDECFNDVERDGDRERMPDRYGHKDRSESCQAAKKLAMCLEDRGKQACDDWDDPMNNEDRNDNRNDDNQHSNNNNNNGRDREKNKEGKKALLNSNRG